MVLTEEQLESFGELINLEIGKSISNLIDKGNPAIIFHDTKIRIGDSATLKEGLVISQKDYSFRLALYGEFSGIAELVFPIQNKSQLGSLLIGKQYNSVYYNSTEEEALSEISNILLNSIMAAASNLLSTYFQYKLIVESNHSNLEMLSRESNNSSQILFSKICFSLNDLPIEFNLLVNLDEKAFAILGKILARGHLLFKEL